MKLSLCMIVKNEEAVLSRCLDSIKDSVDEIIIVDTGSCDNTVKIALNYTKNVYHFKWCNDFALARNFAFSLASGDYLMWLDADDVVPQKTVKAIKQLKSHLTADIYMLKYDIAFDANGKPTFSYFRERIIKNNEKARWVGAVHECIPLYGNIEKLNLSIYHKKEQKIEKNAQKNRNLRIYEEIKAERSFSSREEYYYARELFDHKKYAKCIKILKNFINRKDAWIENIIEAQVLIALSYGALNKPEEKLEYLLNTLKYDLPRPNVCCYIADHFLISTDFAKAIYWYKLALNYKNPQKIAFRETVYEKYYPCLQLCYAYFKLGDNKKANMYNEKAGKVNMSETVRRNREYFKSIGLN